MHTPQPGGRRKLLRCFSARDLLHLFRRYVLRFLLRLDQHGLKNIQPRFLTSNG